MANKKADKIYIDAEGNESRHASAKAVALIFRFVNGHEETIRPSELPKEMVVCGALHGFSQKIGDGYASSKTVDEAIEKAQTVIENLVEGTWIDRTEGAVRTTVLAEALHMCKQDKYPSIEVAAKEIKENWDNDKRKAVLDAKSGVPQLIAAYASIQAKRAMDRANKLSEAANAPMTEEGGASLAAL